MPVQAANAPIWPTTEASGASGVAPAFRNLLTQDVLDWLLGGDPAISFQVRRDLLCGAGAEAIRQRIAGEGWGAAFLAARRPDGHWGRGFYQPKWTSTHYTLLDLAMLGLPGANRPARESVDMVLDAPRGSAGGINFARSLDISDVCINGMILSYGSHFRPEDARLDEIVEYLLRRRQPDGGWNCDYWRGSSVSSLHTTLRVLEGLLAYRRTGRGHDAGRMELAIASGVEFMLEHHLFRSRRTGAVIDPRFLRLTYPPRWRFDILGALDFLQQAAWPADPRIGEALLVIQRKRRRDGRWAAAAPHPGAVHFHMEKAGEPSRWNTLRSLRVLAFCRSEPAVAPLRVAGVETP
ncbi:MAG: hypothetical protein KIS68_04305 [Bauldia sp.]|nr:hypothetical protein [Bauldia sp.]